jgi:hypothetical protein
MQQDALLANESWLASMMTGRSRYHRYRYQPLPAPGGKVRYRHQPLPAAAMDPAAVTATVTATRRCQPPDPLPLLAANSRYQPLLLLCVTVTAVTATLSVPASTRHNDRDIRVNFTEQNEF